MWFLLCFSVFRVTRVVCKSWRLSLSSGGLLSCLKTQWQVAYYSMHACMYCMCTYIVITCLCIIALACIVRIFVLHMHILYNVYSIYNSIVPSYINYLVINEAFFYCAFLRFCSRHTTLVRHQTSLTSLVPRSPSFTSVWGCTFVCSCTNVPRVWGERRKSLWDWRRCYRGVSVSLSQL